MVCIENDVKTIVYNLFPVRPYGMQPVPVQENAYRFCKSCIPLLLAHFLAFRCKPGNIFRGPRAADPDWMVLREFYCPGCATRLDVEVVPDGYPFIVNFEPDFGALAEAEPGSSSAGDAPGS